MEKNAAVNENSDSIGTEKEVRASVAFPQNAWYNDKIKMLIRLTPCSLLGPLLEGAVSDS